MSLRGRFFCLCSFLVALVVMGCSGSDVKKTEKIQKAFAKPGLEYRGIKFMNQSFMGMDVKWKFELISKDARKASIVTCPYKLQLQDMQPVEGSINPGGDVAGENSVELETTVAIPWPEEKAKVKEFLERKRIPYEFFLDCKLQTPDGATTVSASDSGSVPLPKLPQLTVTGANAEKFSGTDIRLNFEVSILNENPFNIKIRKIVYKITAEGKPMSEGELTVVEVVPSSNEASYDISTGTLSGSDSSEIREMIKKPSINYHLEGKVILGDFEIPVDDKGQVSFPH